MALCERLGGRQVLEEQKEPPFCARGAHRTPGPGVKVGEDVLEDSGRGNRRGRRRWQLAEGFVAKVEEVTAIVEKPPEGRPLQKTDHNFQRFPDMIHWGGVALGAV